MGSANAYPRAVRPGGNARAVEAMARAFTLVDARWRGLGTIPASGMAVHPQLALHDARRRFPLAAETTAQPDDAPGCLCSRVMIGLAEPEDCSLFGAVCTPETPRGPCMVVGGRNLPQPSSLSGRGLSGRTLNRAG